MPTSPFALENDPVAAAEARRDWERIVATTVVVACCAYVLWQLSPGFAPWRLKLGLLFTDTTANGGDMGAHVWWPAFLRDHWFARGRLSGWAPDWYGGFPVGQFYFPVPALAVAALDVVLPYNVAFKIVTAAGPVLLPAGAYAFARGARFPWPAPPLFALAAVRYLYEVRTVDGQATWTIYGGNLAGNLAGEFSFTLALALGLFCLGALARTLDTGRRAWLPAVLLALTVTTHLIVAAFVAAGALVIWLVRRPWRTWPVAGAIAGVATLLVSVWTVPLLATQAFTTNMNYEKVGLDNPNVTGEELFSDFLFRLPWWLWLLLVAAVVGGAWWRRTATLTLVAMATIFGAVFWNWPEIHVWNTRFLPFYWLSIALLGALGAVELIRLASAGAVAAADWIRAGEERERAGPDAPSPSVDSPGSPDPDIAAPAPVRPPGYGDPATTVLTHRTAGRRVVERRRRVVAAAVTSALVAAIALGVLVATHADRGFIPGWTRWNYSGYEAKGAAWDEYSTIIATMDGLEPGRALWEHDSEALNRYGTSLALELLPYWTDGRIGSMEGLYFESAASTPYHFLTVSELSQKPSNPVRGLVYGQIGDDFDLGVRHLQMLGVRYYMAQSDQAKRVAAENPDLTLVAEVPDLDGAPPDGWEIYEVAGADLVAPLEVEPIVVTGLAPGRQSQCWSTDAAWRDPELGAWECTAAPWFRDASMLDRPFAADGPPEWQRVDRADLADAAPAPLAPVTVSDVVEETDRISFTVSEPGVPVVVRSSYFPGWAAEGADGPWRLSPNLMVVVPTEPEVTLTYGLTSADWAGRILTLIGLAGLVALVRWRPPERFAARPGVGDGERAALP